MVQFAENRVCVLSPLDEINDVRFLVDDFESDFSNQSNEILFDMLGPPSMGTIFQRYFSKRVLRFLFHFIQIAAYQLKPNSWHMKYEYINKSTVDQMKAVSNSKPSDNIFERKITNKHHSNV